MPVNLANEGHVLADLKCSTYCLERGNWWGGGRGGEGGKLSHDNNPGISQKNGN